jgi:hypothetical protein
MKKVFVLFVLLSFVSCQKEVQLVQAVSTIDTTVVDHSPVYIFLKKKGKTPLQRLIGKTLSVQPIGFSTLINDCL